MEPAAKPLQSWSVGTKPEEVAKARQLGKEMARDKLPAVLKAGLQR